MHVFVFFFFNDTATTEIYTLSLHDALPIFRIEPRPRARRDGQSPAVSAPGAESRVRGDGGPAARRSEEHTSELQSQSNLVCRLLLEKKKIETTTQAHKSINFVKSDQIKIDN